MQQAKVSVKLPVVLGKTFAGSRFFVSFFSNGDYEVPPKIQSKALSFEKKRKGR